MNCDSCGTPATVNVQKAWISWEYNPETEEYSKNHNLLLDAEEPTDSENLHLCRECFYNWKRGDITL